MNDIIPTIHKAIAFEWNSDKEGGAVRERREIIPVDPARDVSSV